MRPVVYEYIVIDTQQFFLAFLLLIFLKIQHISFFLHFGKASVERDKKQTRYSDIVYVYLCCVRANQRL